MFALWNYSITYHHQTNQARAVPRARRGEGERQDTGYGAGEFDAALPTAHQRESKSSANEECVELVRLPIMAMSAKLSC